MLVKKDINDLIKCKTWGAIIHCKVNWVQAGKKSSKYFLNLEKHNFNNKVIKKLHCKGVSFATEKDSILSKQKKLLSEIVFSKRDFISKKLFVRPRSS